MRRFMAALACIALVCLSACSLQLEDEHVVYSREPVTPEAVDLAPRIQIEPVLYFLNQNQTRLTAEPRVLHLEQDESPELAIVQAMLEGPVSSDLRGIGTGLAAQRVEVMPDLVNVYLLTVPEATIPTDRQLTVAKLALAAAIIDYSGVRYVNVLVDGRQIGFTDAATGSTIPTGALTRTADLADELSTLEQRAAAATSDMYAALYFLDPSESYLLPQVARISFRQDQAPDLLVTMLLRGPENRYSFSPCMDVGVELQSWEYTEVDQSRFLRLVFNRTPVVYTSSFVDGERMSAAALTYTLTQFITGIDGIQIAVAANSMQYRTYKPEEFADLVGNRVLIYLPDSAGGMTLTGVERVLPQGETNDPAARLRVLFEGPQDTDTRDVWPAAPAGITDEAIMEVYIAGDIVVVDLDDVVTEILSKSAEQDERVFIFSIVNTLTNMDYIRRVLFLVNGERVEYLGIDALAVLDPLMKNPGIVK